MVDWLRIFEYIAWEIHDRIKPLFGSEVSGRVLGRGVGGDLSRMIDFLAEKIVVKILMDLGVSCILVSEECGFKRIDGGEDVGYVVLDGVDGTTNAVHGLPFASTSLAFANGPQLKDVKVGLVMDFSRDKIFYAEWGGGAFLDEKRLKASSTIDIREALISFELSFPSERKEKIQCLLPLLARSGKIRLLGSSALELCYIASGSLDAFVDLRGVSRATDIAAAYLILKEAGGVMVSPGGGRLNIDLKPLSRSSFVAASNQKLCERILGVLCSSRESR